MRHLRLQVCFFLAGCISPDVADDVAVAIDTVDTVDTDAMGDLTGESPDTDVPADTVAPPSPSDAVFDLDTIHDIELTLSADAWSDISSNPYAETWHTADFRWDGEAVSSVGVRAFGFSSHAIGKPPLKVDFNRVVRGQRWRELETLKLRNGYYDRSFMHDALEPWMLRRAGVPASRTGWARVWVNGERVGLYTVMEAIDDRFLKRSFGNDDGPLYSIDSIRGHGLMPLDDALMYFQYNTEVTGDGSDLEDLTRIVAEGSDEELAAVIDLDGFFTESIVRSLAGSQDCFSADGNNFYLYNDPGVDADASDLHGTWRVIPWDYNFDFTAFGLSAALRVDISQPWTTSDYAYDPTTGEPYADVLMARQIAGGRDVRARVEELAGAGGPLAYPEVLARVQSWQSLIAADVELDPLGSGVGAFWNAVADDLLYVHMRWSRELGAEVADCAALEPGAVWARELSPTGEVGYASLAVDGWYWPGNTVTCDSADDLCAGFQIRQTHHCTGLYAHAPSDISLTVPEGMRALRGAVGLQLFAQDCSDGAVFSVSQGGVVLWQSGVLTSYTEAEELGDVAVAPGEVRLTVDPLGGNACDTSAWVDLRAVP
jgi:hypothetical protein